MHHGHFTSILDVVELYNLGSPSPIQARLKGTSRDSLQGKSLPILRKLNLSKDEVKSLVAFINTLATPTRRMQMPALPK
jgi:cytochrome c peroxidase